MTINTGTLSIAVPLGAADARAHVHQDGTVHLAEHDGHPLPAVLRDAVWGLLRTWAIECDGSEGHTGRTMIPPHGWRELFAHRCGTATSAT